MPRIIINRADFDVIVTTIYFRRPPHATPHTPPITMDARVNGLLLRSNYQAI